VNICKIFTKLILVKTSENSLESLHIRKVYKHM